MVAGRHTALSVSNRLLGLPAEITALSMAMGAVAFVVVNLLTRSEKVAAKRREYDEFLGSVSKYATVSGIIASRCFNFWGTIW